MRPANWKKTVFTFLAAFLLSTGPAPAAAQEQPVVPGTVSEQPGPGLVGPVQVVADEESNTLMIMTASRNIDRVREIIAQLDRSVPQVLIKALVVEVTHDRMLDLGTEFSVLNLSSDGSRVFSEFERTQAGGLNIRFLKGDVDIAVAALQKVGKLDILSRPYILASDNQPAEIVVGNRVPIVTATRVTEAGQVISTIQYQDIGIILRVTPHINPDGLVILDVAPEISALTGTNVSITEGVSAPVYATRSATSRVAIQDGQTIVIGGLMEDRLTESERKVPLLGDIPLLGGLFRRTTSEKSKTELLIFLTPQVALQPEAMEAISDREIEQSRIAPGIIRESAGKAR